MRPWNQDHEGLYTNEAIYLLIVTSKVRRFARILREELTKRIHMRITIFSQIFNTVCIKIWQFAQVVCQLLNAEQHHCKKQLFIAAYFRAAESVSESIMIHEIWYPGSFQPDSYQGRRWMKNRVLNKVRALWVPGDAFQIDKRVSNISDFYQ